MAQFVAFIGFAIGNISLNVFNQWALNRHDGPKFVFPVFYTMFHMLISAIASWLLAACVKEEDFEMPSFRQLWSYKLAIFPIAYCTTISTWLNNESFMLLSLFMNQTIRALGPLPTVIFSWFFAGKKYGWGKLACVFMICTGTGLACSWQFQHSTRNDTTAGVVMCVISTIMASLKPVIAMMVMEGNAEEERLPPLSVLYYDSAIAFLMMFLYWVCSDERDTSLAYLASPNTTAVGVEIITIGAGMAFVYNLSTYYFVQLFSAVFSTVSANGVKSSLIIIAALDAGVDSAVTWTGVVIVITSFAVFTFLTLQYPDVPDIPGPASEPELGLRTKKDQPTEETPLSMPSRKSRASRESKYSLDEFDEHARILFLTQW